MDPGFNSGVWRSSEYGSHDWCLLTWCPINVFVTFAPSSDGHFLIHSLRAMADLCLLNYGHVKVIKQVCEILAGRGGTQSGSGHKDKAAGKGCLPRPGTNSEFNSPL